MGYTHYWKFNPTAKTPAQFKMVIAECKEIIKSQPEIKIFGWSEKKGGFFAKPELTQKAICINGDESQNLDHESFVFEPKGRTDFNFCKTARKPYDLVVGLMLISLANHLDEFSFSSDGDMEEWTPIFEEYERLFKDSINPAKFQSMKEWVK